MKLQFVSRSTGEEFYLITFQSPIVDIRDGREKSQIQFTAYGLHHNRKWGQERAAAVAHTAYAASRMEDSLGRFGCGVPKPNGCHGDARNEFRVHSFGYVVNNQDWDPMVETFAPREAFCWNSVEVDNIRGVQRCKCLGHPPQVPDELHPRKIMYADQTVGQVREHIESVFLSLKELASKVDGTLHLGHTGETFHSCPPEREQLLLHALSFYWTHCKEPITGMCVHNRIKESTVKNGKKMVVWQADRGTTLRCRFGPDGSAHYEEAKRELMDVVPGLVRFDGAATCIIYICAREDLYQDYGISNPIELTCGWAWKEDVFGTCTRSETTPARP